MYTSVLVLIVGSSLSAFGCIDDSNKGETQEIVDNLVLAGHPASDIQLIDGKVYVGNDAEVSLQASREMIEGASGEEQYRTHNLVAGSNPTIICVNGAAFFADPVLSAGLDLALENYNQLFNAGTTRLFFFRVNGGPIPGCTFFINGIIDDAIFIGSSGFPSAGQPFTHIIIGYRDRLLVSLGVNLVEHVITHELGHCIGFRHADYFNPTISCLGTPPPESNGPAGAVLIPGTPAGAFVGSSIMNTCPHASENGEFTVTDVTALDVLY